MQKIIRYIMPISKAIILKVALHKHRYDITSISKWD